MAKRQRRLCRDWPISRRMARPFRVGHAALNSHIGVFYYLLRQRLLRPVLPVTCPHCTTTTAMTPEQLITDMRCEMCLDEFPIGYALGQHARNDWHYQLAGHVGVERLSETLPIMAALHLLVTRGRSAGTAPYVLGWKLDGPSIDCEVDLAVVVEQRGVPIVIIGEAKSYRDSIDDNDVANLVRIQERFRSIGVECFVLVAVMRDLTRLRLKRYETHLPTLARPSAQAHNCCQYCRLFSRARTFRRLNMTESTIPAPGDLRRALSVWRRNSADAISDSSPPRSVARDGPGGIRVPGPLPMRIPSTTALGKSQERNTMGNRTRCTAILGTQMEVLLSRESQPCHERHLIAEWCLDCRLPRPPPRSAQSTHDLCGVLRRGRDARGRVSGVRDVGGLARRSRHTFSAVFGAVIARGLDYRETFQVFRPASIWPRSASAE